MRRILFVDDEPNVLDGIRRSLRTHRHEWEMVFVTSGQAAVEEAERQPFDVVVSDMRMPGMDGSSLLRWFHNHRPATIRILLSGYAESEAIMRALPIAHQFLGKPCDPVLLDQVVRRAMDLRRIVEDSVVQGLVGGITELPSRPATFASILRALADPQVDVRRISQIIERDSAMVAKVLQLVNSAFFGLQQRIDDVEHAISFLGLDTVRDLALSAEVFRPPAHCSEELEVFFDALQIRSAWTAKVARRLCKEKRSADLAFTAGVLHDVGMLVLASEFSDEYVGVLGRATAGPETLAELEREKFGVGHEMIGAYLLGVWGLPYPIVEISAYHDRPGTATTSAFFELTAVHAASAIVEKCLRDRGAPFAWERRLDEDHLRAAGVWECLPGWIAAVESDLTSSEGVVPT